MAYNQTKCGSCLQPVGVLFDGTDRPYKTVVQDGVDHHFCIDKAACEQRWQAANEPDPRAESDPNAE